MPSWLLPALSGACVMLVLMLLLAWGLIRAVVKMMADWLTNGS